MEREGGVGRRGIIVLTSTVDQYAPTIRQNVRKSQFSISSFCFFVSSSLCDFVRRSDENKKFKQRNWRTGCVHRTVCVCVCCRIDTLPVFCSHRNYVITIIRFRCLSLRRLASTKYWKYDILVSCAIRHRIIIIITANQYILLPITYCYCCCCSARDVHTISILRLHFSFPISSNEVGPFTTRRTHRPRYVPVECVCRR